MDTCISGHDLSTARRIKPSGQKYCLECNKIRTDKHRKKYPLDWAKYQKKANLKRYYGITPAEYDTYYSRQNGVCAICKQPPGKRKLAVDHDHVTKRIRGLLCARCNTGLGQFIDSVNLLQKAVEYLK